MTSGPLTGETAVRPGPDRTYTLHLLAFLASLALLLLALVEMRRGFLFPLSDYFRVGAPSAILYFDPRQLLLLVVGGAGLWLSYRRLAALEQAVGGDGLKTASRVVAVAILLLLVVDLFTYRGVPAYRIAAAGKLGVGQAIPITAMTGWARPFREGLNYMALVWHATLLAILLGSLFLTLMAGRLKGWLSGRGFGANLRGAALAVPQPFCSCCAAPIGASLYRQGASLGATLAFVVSAPMLNVTGLLLVALLLPWKFAALRVAGGVVVGLFATYVVSSLSARWLAPGRQEARPSRVMSGLAALLERYTRLFQFERLMTAQPADSPAALVSAWLSTAWRLGRVIVPVLLVGSVITAAILMAVPSQQNNVPGVLVAATIGTLLMVPTWTEIAVASQLVKEGMTGPAGTLLITLPAVSLPCLAVIGGAVRSLKVSVLLAATVFVLGVLAGLVFLVI